MQSSPHRPIYFSELLDVIGNVRGRCDANLSYACRRWRRVQCAEAGGD
jgi:hypothetical protein